LLFVHQKHELALEVGTFLLQMIIANRMEKVI